MYIVTKKKHFASRLAILMGQIIKDSSHLLCAREGVDDENMHDTAMNTCCLEGESCRVGFVKQ
jgi:hypothetical protein